MKKSLTIEELKSRVGKPIFVMATKEEFKHRTAWHILSKISAFKLDNESNGYVEFTDCECIKFENIQFFRFFDTEVSTTELKEILEVEEKKKKTGYERVEIKKDYYTITSTKDVTDMREYDVFNTNNEKRYKNGNYFNDEALAENIARAERLKYQLRRYAALNGGIPSQKDWQSNEIKKWYIDYLYHTETIVFFDTYCYKTFGQIYFKDIKACEKAIEIFKDELIWYFTEFEEMLY